MTFMSNSPMSRGVGYPAGAVTLFMDGAEMQRKCDALRSELAIVEEAHRRLEEIQHGEAAGERHLVPGASGAAAESSHDFYPLDDEVEEEEGPMQWQDQVCRQMVDSSRQQRRWEEEDHLFRAAAMEAAAATSNGHSGRVLIVESDNHDLDVDNDGSDEISRDIVVLGLHVPHIQQQTGELPADGGGGFGAVPASAAAIAGLGKHRYNGSGADGTCVICMRQYKKGRRLHVMPCAHKHRFHGRCIRKWLSRSNMCPLCRHALPTAPAAEQQRGGGGSHRRGLMRVNLNLY